MMAGERLLAAPLVVLLSIVSLDGRVWCQQLVYVSDELEAQRQVCEQESNVTRLLYEKFSHLFSQEEQLASARPDGCPSTINRTLAPPSSDKQQQQQASLETRTSGQAAPSEPQAQGPANELPRRNFFRILNRVFSRIELPEVFKRSNQVRAPFGAGGAPATGHCALHIGCIDELPNFPSLLKLKPNVSATFTIYSRDNGPKAGGQRILYEPIVHHQLEDADASELELQADATRSLAEPQQQRHRPMAVAGEPGQPGAGPAAMGGHRRGSNKNNNQRRHQTASSWRSAAKVAHTLELPFDLAALEQSSFNSSLTTRVIVGGYFAKEDEEWIDELVKQWLLLEPCNVIKVSWQDSNRGLYHTAAYNSRIVGRQLSLFLHYLNELFHIDLENKFHLVGHSLGAHIAGFVGADNDSKIARITGLDPAGPIFVELNASMRLDATDAKFVDVMHTNGGTITKGALGLSTPSGHVDYYCNGGALQPGCYFSSVTKSIMDPVERVACNHRRSYRYFTEIIKLAALNGARARPAAGFPHAFLFQAKHEDLVRLVQPEISVISAAHEHLLASPAVQETGSASGADHELAELPLRWRVEFHSLKPRFPANRRGLYFFKTRSEAPFFGSRQFAITIKSEQPIKRKIVISAKINNTLVAEFELDELDGSFSCLCAPNNPKIIDYAKISQGEPPDLWLMWRQRSFNLLLGHQNELRLNTIELNLLEADGDEPETGELAGNEPATGDTSAQGVMRSNEQQQQQQIRVIRYVWHNSSGSYLKTSANNLSAGHFALARNQWHRFEGRLERSFVQ